ncbi:MAG: beta-lactamase family protein [Acetobacteraceae bacterium]|nr:beta-lactamase family protein [Acetobacteraceae bacterium]
MRRIFAAALISLWTVASGAVELPTAKPEEVGLARLDRIASFLRAESEAKRLPGSVVMIARNGRVAYAVAFGVRDPATGTPMQMDSIFRMYSMTKPVTAVAILMLMEEGKLRLADPASRFLQALKNLKVISETVDTQGQRRTATVPAEREITILDLLRHTAGLSYGVFGNSLVDQAMGAAGLNDPDMRLRWTDQKMVEELGKLPLLFQPGTQWQYSRATDVLLAVVEAASGLRGDDFYEQRIFKPLGMIDTSFNLPPEKMARMAQSGIDPTTGRAQPLTDVSKIRLFLGGGEGLLSTASDYMKFALMLANGGELGGVRLISRASVALMSANHLPPGVGAGPNYLPGPGYGFGLTVAVRTEAGQSSVPGSIGEYNWGGYAGTKFWIDPKERLVPILLIQAPLQSRNAGNSFRGLVYGAIAD